MTADVLIVTGGLITSQERSLVSAARKWMASLAAAQHPWLDIKVKLAMAEPLVAKACEEWQLPVLAPRLRRKVREFFAPDPSTAPDAVETPSLTEVVLATLLEKAGLTYRLLPIARLFDRPAEAERLLSETSCVFLSTTYLHDLSDLQAVVARLKRPHNRIVAGGALLGVIDGHWQGMPEIDVVAVGYGELLVEALAGWIRSGYQTLEPPAGGRLQAKRYGRFVYSGAPPTRSLDALPTPDWSQTQRDYGQRFPMIYYESVRGCPYRCNFCNYPFLFDDATFRYKSAGKIADDWERYVGELGVEYITCLDSLFTLPRDRLIELCRLLRERRVAAKWICYARADDLADERTVAMMREAGAHQVQIGIESGDSQLLANMNKACTVEANGQALENCRRHGLTSVVSLIVGFPGETPQSLERTYRFLEAMPPDFYFLATFSTRVPGVPLLSPENRRRFGLEVMDNLYNMAPYWRHDTMSCVEVGNHVRHLDRRLMRNRVALNATLFYRGLLGYRPAQREPLLDFQARIAKRHPLVATGFELLHRWTDRRLRADVKRHFAGTAPPVPEFAR